MKTSNSPAIQDLYPEDFAHCYGCGRSNSAGHQLKSYPVGEELVAHYQPRAEDVSVPGFVYGGLLASLIDCHAMATAAASDLPRDYTNADGPAPRYVTASLRVDYLKPTPLGCNLEVRSRVTEKNDRKAVVSVTLVAEGVTTVRAEVVAVRMPKSMVRA